MLLLCIADIIGIYKDFLNKKGKRNKDFEALYYVWQGVQKYRFAKSRETPQNCKFSSLMWDLMDLSQQHTFSHTASIWVEISYLTIRKANF